MDERIIPTIVLALNFLSMIGLVFFQFFVDISFLLTILSWLSLVIVAYWVYENSKRTEFLEKHIWRRLDEAEADLKLANKRIGDMEEEIKKLESVGKI